MSRTILDATILQVELNNIDWDIFDPINDGAATASKSVIFDN